MKLASHLAAALALCGACSKHDQPAPPPQAKPVPAPAVAAKPAGRTPVTVDPEVRRLVGEVASKCNVDVDNVGVSCDGDTAFAMINYAADKKISNLFESLGEIALTDGAKDPKLFTAVLATWNTFKDRDLEKKNATPAAAERVLALWPQAAKSSDFAYATAIPLLAGKRADLTALLTKMSDDAPLKAKAIQNYLDWGGMDALPDVQAFAKSSSDLVRAAALESAAIALGGPYEPSQLADADRPKLCDWVKSVAQDASVPGTSETFAAAMQALSRCKGTYIDDALAAIDSRLQTTKLTQNLANSLQHQCWAEGLVGGTPNGTPEQCAKAFDILSKAIVDPAVPTDALTAGIYGLEALGTNSPPLKPKAKAAIGKFLHHKDKTVASSAKDSLGRLK